MNPEPRETNPDGTRPEPVEGQLPPAVSVGTAVPALERTITLTDMVAYAGATWDWHRMHYDPEFARARKFDAPVVDGQVFGALLVEQLQDWLGPDAFVRELSFSFRSLVFAGETVRCEGTVTEASGERIAVELRVVVDTADGAEPRVAVAPAAAVVLLGSAEGPGAESAGGQVQPVGAG